MKLWMSIGLLVMMSSIIGMEESVSPIKKRPVIKKEEDNLTQCKRHLEQACKELNRALNKRKQADPEITEKRPEQLQSLFVLLHIGCAELRQDFQQQYNLQQPATKRRASSLSSITKR